MIYSWPIVYDVLFSLARNTTWLKNKNVNLPRLSDVSGFGRLPRVKTILFGTLPTVVAVKEP